MCVRVWSSCVVAPTQRDVPRQNAKPAVRRRKNAPTGGLTAERSTGGHRSTRACAPFEARFHRYRKEDIFFRFRKKIFRNKNEYRLKAHTTNAPKASRNNIRQLGRVAQNRRRRWWRFPRRASRRVAKKRTWRYGGTPRKNEYAEISNCSRFEESGSAEPLFVFTARGTSAGGESRARACETSASAE